MRKRVKIGDIIEIETPNGFAYAYYTHKHPMFGALIKIIKGTFNEMPHNLAELLNDEYQFITFFPLGAATNREIVKIVGNQPLSQKSNEFPLFKAGIPNNKGKVENWWLWDGEKEWEVGKLKKEQENYPVREIINDTLLIERICNGWNHKHEI